jgi:hypothetical protein
MNYDPNTFTWGYELEMGDVPKNIRIPTEMGKWEQCETDILNLRDPYRGLAVDPNGISPPVGGEVNLRPAKDTSGLLERISSIYKLFRDAGHEPTQSSVNHGHVHCHVPGLTEDIDGLKRLVKYVCENQATVIDAVYGFQDHPDMNGKARTYLKLDGGRHIPDWMCSNIIEKAQSFKDFIDIHCCGKDGVSRGRPVRYGINLYNLKHTSTIEMRCFRGSLDMREIEDSLLFTKELITAALNNGPSASEILKSREWVFPKFYWDAWEWECFEKTKQETTGPANKNRQFWLAT